MHLGMIGLGKMGGNMVERLARGGHRVVAYSRTAASRQKAVDRGAQEALSLADLAAKLGPPRIAWLMLPAGDTTDQTIGDLIPLLSPGDIVVDGGNSYYKDDLRHGATLREHGIHFVDVGTSGGVWGLAEGYSMMVGGDDQVVERLRPIFETLAPAPDKGWGRVGPTGAGHFVKMIHNGIEYGMMQAYAEGFAIVERKAEFGIDLPQIAEIWRHGSVVRSWLLDLIARALAANPDLSGIAPFVPDSGEGRWTVFESIDLDVSAPVISLALMERFRSRDTNSFGDRLLAVMREQFGGHDVKREA